MQSQMAYYQVWFRGSLVACVKDKTIEELKEFVQGIWKDHCKEPYPSPDPEFVWMPHFGLWELLVFWWPHKPFTSEAERWAWMEEQMQSGHCYKFEVAKVAVEVLLDIQLTDDNLS